MTSGTLVLAAVDAIATVIWYSMLEVLPVEGGGDGRILGAIVFVA